MKNRLILLFLFIFSTNYLLADNLYKNATKAREKLGKDLAEKYDIQFLLMGAGTLVDSKRQPIDFSYTSQQPQNLDYVRVLALHLASDLVQGFLSNPIIVQSHNETHKTWKKMTKAEITYDAIGFKITYWDENINRFTYPYIAQVKFVDEKILYYYADPKTQALLEPIVETHEEAYQKAFGNNQLRE